jgi:hypothetical protein
MSQAIAKTSRSLSLKVQKKKIRVIGAKPRVVQVLSHATEPKVAVNNTA